MTTTSADRAEIERIMFWIVEHRARVHYPPIVNGRIIRQESIAHIRTFADLQALVMRSHAPTAAGDGLTVDCSQLVCAVLLAAGLKNPNGRPMDGATSSLLVSPLLPHYSDPREAYTGAIAILGPAGGDHGMLVYARDPIKGDPLMFSHGGNGVAQARIIRLSLEVSAHRPPLRMLSIANLG